MICASREGKEGREQEDGSRRQGAGGREQGADLLLFMPTEARLSIASPALLNKRYTRCSVAVMHDADVLHVCCCVVRVLLCCTSVAVFICVVLQGSC